MALLLRLEIDDDAHVGGDGVLRGGEDRIEVELDDLGEIADELRDLDDHVGERVAADGLAAAHALQHLGRLDAVEHRQGVVAGRGGEPEGDVLQDFHEHAAETEGDQLAERAVGDRSDDDLGAALQHLLNLHAVDLGVGLVLFGIGENGVVALRHLVGALQADQHAAGFRLVQDVGRDDLQHHRIAHPVGELRRLLGRVGHSFLRHGDAIGVADQLAFGRRQARAAFGLGLVENFANRVAPARARGGHAVPLFPCCFRHYFPPARVRRAGRTPPFHDKRLLLALAGRGWVRDRGCAPARPRLRCAPRPACSRMVFGMPKAVRVKGSRSRRVCSRSKS